MKLITLAVLITVYFVLIPFGLWASVRIIRRQRNEDLRWHRDSLLAYIRAELAKQR